MVEEAQSTPKGTETAKAFGLTVSSCIHCPELLPGEGRPDVTVVYGDVPSGKADVPFLGVYYQASPGQLMLDIEGVGRFLIRGGTEIVIDRHPDATDDDVRLFLLGSAFAALMHQRGLLVLHGSTIRVDDGCIVFLGRSGMGKSTLATVLARRGYPCLGDDVCAVSFGEDGLPYAAPVYPQAKLKLDSLEHFGIDPERLRRIRPSREKRALPLDTSAWVDRIRVKRLYVLSRPTKDSDLIPPVKKPMTGAPKIRVLRDYTYRVEFLEGLDLRLPHFKQLMRLASHVPVTRVFWRKGDFNVEELATAIESDFRS